MARLDVMVALMLVLVSAGAGCFGNDDGGGNGSGDGNGGGDGGNGSGGGGGSPRLAKVADGFSAPLLVTYAGDGSGRVFVVEQAGRVHIMENGVVRGEPFLDISDLTRGQGEQGLLGIAFHPDYAENGVVLVSHTALDGASILARYTRDEVDANRADHASREVLLTVDQPFGNHNGGMIAFGPDGHLYYALGDGGLANDPQGNGQNTQTLLGSILRIHIEATGPYTIPDDNPHVGNPGARDEIWAHGLRNPWRFSFDRETGDLWMGDVGQNSIEEINFQPASSNGGENYGWSIFEGSSPGPAGMSVGSAAGTPPYTAPHYEYGRAGGQCSVTGGYVYRGNTAPSLQGTYLYGDYCSGHIWGLTDGQAERLFETPYAISSFGEDEAGNVYVTDLAGGGVYMMTAS